MSAFDTVLAADLEAAGFENATTVGRGGFGVVLRCLQRSLDRTVAVKVLTADLNPDNFERFLREQRAMGRLSGHPNIVNIHHYGTTRGGRPYIVMQYHPLGSLESRIRQLGPIDWRESLPLGVKMAGALETAHRLGLLHRDVKPANILLTDYGEPQLADFGIAHIAGGFETSTGVITGSPAYTAPEVLKGQSPTPASDVYSLGATLFCAITGHAAFQRREGEQLVAQFLRISAHEVPDLHESGIPRDVSAAIEHAMKPVPGNRPASALAFGEELRRAEEGNGLVVVDMALPALTRGEQPVGDATQAQSPLAEMMTGSGQIRAETVLTPPTPSTKYRPPAPNRPLVERRRLVDLLRMGKGRHLTLIHAPAGYGKTTLAAQWRELLVEEGIAVAWLSVDPDDNNVVWFLSHLVEAIRQVRPTLARELGQALEEHGDQAERYVLSTLINEIDRSGNAVAVVIDDWHRVSSLETQAAIGFLLDNCCAQLQVIVTSRTRSGLPLSRMQVRNEVLEIDAAALRFDPSESRTFLVDLGGLPLGQHDVENLTHSTDGWVAALQLASLSLRGCDDPTEMIGSLSGRHHAIGEFLAENVLGTLEPALLDFLMATSITGRVSGDLASTLASVPDGQIRLEEVEQRDLFLRRIDEEGEWFRYHHLFAEYLRRRLERGRPDRIDELHRRASRWFADHRFLSEAVDHALAAGDEHRAVALVEKNGTYLLEHSQMSTLLGLVAKLPSLVVGDSAPLQLAVAWANILLQRADQAQGALHHIRPSLDKSTLPDTERDSIRVEALVAEGVLEIYADRIDGVDALVEEALTRPETLRPWTVSVAANVKTFCLIYRFDYAAATKVQDWARTYHGRTNGPFSVMYGYAFAGIAAYEQLDLAAVEDNFTNALEVARRAGGAHSHATRLAGALLGELRYAQGRIDEAERLIDESYQLGSEGGVVDFMIARYVVGARIKAWRGDRIAAADYLADGARTAELLALDRLRARIDNERILLGLPAGALAVSRPRDTSRAPSADGIGQVTAQIEDDTAIRSLLAKRSPEHTARAVAWARQWWQSLTGTGRRRAMLAATRLLVTCLAADGRVEEAKAHLAEAAAICAGQGMNRYLLDGGEEVAALLVALRDDQRAGRWNDEWASVPEVFLEAMEGAANRDRRPGPPQ
ncbi:protein kinase (plasmid) [Rhodococcus sp. JS3073]|nr:serine/threonine-protein kinase [Rhodococcus sp. JS3073]WAM19429.1 protein kinase [Rhodococcus sp. JS3073]